MTRPTGPRALAPSTARAQNCRTRISPPRIVAAVLGTAIAVSFAWPVEAGDLVVRDAQGRRTGTVERSYDGSYVERDATGSVRSGIEPGFGDEAYMLRDASGRRTGTVEKSFGDEWVVRDAAGRRKQTIEPAFGGDLVIRDTAGRRIGVIETDD
jgi:hypothetical protein